MKCYHPTNKSSNHYPIKPLICLPLWSKALRVSLPLSHITYLVIYFIPLSDYDDDDNRQSDNLQGQLKRSVIIVPHTSLQFVTVLPTLCILAKIGENKANTRLYTAKFRTVVLVNSGMLTVSLQYAYNCR